MKKESFLPFNQLPFREQVLFLLVPVLSWGGILTALILNFIGIIEDPGSFVYGPVLGSFALCALALLRSKKDIVAILTPVYALIIFFGLDLPVNLALQVLFAATLMALLWRLETRYGNPGNN